MDLLQSYYISSEESDDDERNHTQSEHKPDERDSNFFGFDDSENDSANRDSDDDDNGKEEQLNLDNGELEVPKSKFWDALSSNDLHTAKERSSQLSTDSCHKFGSKNPNTISSDQGQTQLKRNMQKYSHEIPTKNPKTEISSRQSVASNNSNEMTRKIFYVHCRIKTGIHSQNRNRPIQCEERHIPAHGGVVNRVKWNVPQFSHLFVSVSMDSTVKVWNAWSTEGSCAREMRHHGKAVKDAEWSADGRHILTCSYDRCAVLSDVETGKVICKLDHCTYVTCGKFNPVRRSQVMTGCTNALFHWDVRTPDTACREFQYKDEMGQVQDLLFSRDGNVLFTCTDMVTRDSADRNIMAWDYESGVTLSNQIYQERYACTRLKLHPSTSHFLAQSHGGYIALFSVNRPFKMVRSKRFEGHKLLGYNIGFDVSHDGSLVYSGSSDGTIHCYDFQTGKLQRSLPTDLGVCMDVSCHPVLSSTVVTCSWGGSIKVFH